MVHASLLLLLLQCTFLALAYRNVRSPPAPSNTQLNGGGVVRGDGIPRLLELIGSQDRGLKTDKQAEIKRLVDSIGQQNADFVQRDKQMFRKVEGRWRLLYTTEKETLFFARSGLFGSKCLGIYQVIDTATKSINNLIEFENGKSFSVLGEIASSGERSCRVDFKFTKAVIRFPFEVTVPPVGSGWFDNVYVNEKYRLSVDSRGDYLVSTKD